MIIGLFLILILIITVVASIMVFITLPIFYPRYKVTVKRIIEIRFKQWDVWSYGGAVAIFIVAEMGKSFWLPNEVSGEFAMGIGVTLFAVMLSLYYLIMFKPDKKQHSTWESF